MIFPVLNFVLRFELWHLFCKYHISNDLGFGHCILHPNIYTSTIETLMKFSLYLYKLGFHSTLVFLFHLWTHTDLNIRSHRSFTIFLFYSIRLANNRIPTTRRSNKLHRLHSKDFSHYTSFHLYYTTQTSANLSVGGSMTSIFLIIHLIR